MPGSANRSGGDRKSIGSDPFPNDGIPSMPPGLAKPVQTVWQALLDQIPGDFLRGVDTYQLEILAKTIVSIRTHMKLAAKLMKEYDKSKDLDLLKASLSTERLAKAEEQHVSRLSAQFGLSPVDRGRLRFEPVDTNEADDWAAT